MSDDYAIVTFIANDTVEALGDAAIRGWLTFETKEQVRARGLTPVGRVGVTWWQLDAADVDKINENGVDAVFTLDDDHGHRLVAGDWCARAVVQTARNVPLATGELGPVV